MGGRQGDDASRQKPSGSRSSTTTDTLVLVNYTLRLQQRSLVIGCLHDRANIEQLARRSMVISMLIKRAGGL